MTSPTTGVDLPTLGLGIPFEGWTVGRRFRTIGRTVTDADITNFVGVTGMVEVLFTNLDYLEKESLIKGRLAPGALVYAFAEGLLLQPGRGIVTALNNVVNQKGEIVLAYTATRMIKSADGH
jgi:acyl dehydratase